MDREPWRDAIAEKRAPTTDEVAVFVIAEKARVFATNREMPEEHIKDEVLMKLAREVMEWRAGINPWVRSEQMTYGAQRNPEQAP
jgi:hypothetical protein